MTPQHVTRTMLGIAAFLVLAAAWWFLAPTQIGGRTSYATISGTSMEPGLGAGDLAVTREQASYEVGDAVLYRSEQLDAPVLHRIVSIDGDRFVLRGDNRTADDPETPAADQVVGRLWFSVPYLGRAAAARAGARLPRALRVPDRLPRPRRWQGGVETPRAGNDPARAPRPAARAGQRPARRCGADGADRRHRRHRAVRRPGARRRGARRPPASGRRAVGMRTRARSRTRPAFRAARSTPRAPSRRARRPSRRSCAGSTCPSSTGSASEAASDARGGIALDAVVSDRAGWSRTIPLQPLRAFTGPTATAAGVLDLRRVDTLTEQMRRLTGSTTTAFSVEVVPRVQVVGYAGETVLDEEFSPRLPLSLDLTSLRLEAEDPRPRSHRCRTAR